MITRHYFMCVEKPHNDGKGSISKQNCTANCKSWLADPDGMFEQMRKYCEDQLSDRPGDKVLVLAFNRI